MNNVGVNLFSSKREKSGNNMVYFTFKTYCCLVPQSYPTLCCPMLCSPPGSSVHGTAHARILQWVTIPCSRGSSQSRDQTWVSCTGRKILYCWATREAHYYRILEVKKNRKPWHRSSQGRGTCQANHHTVWQVLGPQLKQGAVRVGRGLSGSQVQRFCLGRVGRLATRLKVSAAGRAELRGPDSSLRAVRLPESV